MIKKTGKSRDGYLEWSFQHIDSEYKNLLTLTKAMDQMVRDSQQTAKDIADIHNI